MVSRDIQNTTIKLTNIALGQPSMGAGPTS